MVHMLPASSSDPSEKRLRGSDIDKLNIQSMGPGGGLTRSPSSQSTAQACGIFKHVVTDAMQLSEVGDRERVLSEAFERSCELLAGLQSQVKEAEDSTLTLAKEFKAAKQEHVRAMTVACVA